MSTDGTYHDDDDLVDSAQLAARLRLSREHVVDRLTKKRGFPRPARFVSQRTRWWSWREIDEYLRRQGRR